MQVLKLYPIYHILMTHSAAVEDSHMPPVLFLKIIVILANVLTGPISPISLLSMQQPD